MSSSPVALVTGGSRGIGRGVCVALAERGYRVAVNYAGNLAAAKETVGLLATEGVAVQGDVGLAPDRDRVVDDVLARWGRIDVLVNNAGITSIGRKDLLEATEESWDRVLAVNLKGPYFLTQRVANEMIARTGLVHPTVVNVSSLSAFAASTNRGDYCVSKAGMAMLTQLYAARLAEYGIRVYEVRPGIIDTDMTAGGRERYERMIADGLTPIRRMGAPEDVGRAVASLATGALPYGTGDVIHVDGGYHLRRFP